ncbi:hypothetical protein GCM10010389_37930 [Streptomyces echinoruber]|uniref:Uncharacterized protein n=1 Tax=Streptomyces echinoruber TaxID=68898 RepID=A0A918VG51_9ACTN|nr:hypothetical protein GCM10010389_37930 [Streptomyces echinoruber]
MLWPDICRPRHPPCPAPAQAARAHRCGWEDREVHGAGQKDGGRAFLAGHAHVLLALGVNPLVA